MKEIYLETRELRVIPLRLSSYIQHALIARIPDVIVRRHDDNTVGRSIMQNKIEMYQKAFCKV